MTASFAAAEIKDALIALLDGIKRSDGTAISREMARVDDLAASARPTLPPQLAHFLERRSYAKALAYLDEGYATPGSCVPRK